MQNNHPQDTPANENEWRRRQAQTFVTDPDDEAPGHGPHLKPFYENPQDAIDAIPHMLDNALMMMAYGDTPMGTPPFPVPDDWTRAHYLSWPSRRLGILMVIQNGPSGDSMESLFPFAGVGQEHRITLHQVHVWEAGIEAHIDATLGASDISFFDPLFATNKGWYIGGRDYQFILAGIAYCCRPAESQTVHIDLPIGTQELGTDQLAALIPMEIMGYDRDEYQFHGPVQEVDEVEMLGQPCWKVRTTVMRMVDEGRDIDIDIIVPRQVWDGSAPPTVGQNIEGNLWLQGYLWSPHCEG